MDEHEDDIKHSKAEVEYIDFIEYVEAPTQPSPRLPEVWEPTSPQTDRPVLQERGFFPFIWKRSGPLDPQQLRNRRVTILLVSLAVLFVLLVPSIFAALTALQDYSSLKSLGLAGVHHLLVAKDDLTSAGGSTSSSSTN